MLRKKTIDLGEFPIAGSKLLCISRGKDGLLLASKDQLKSFDSFQRGPLSGNDIGAGDALFAGLCDYYLRQRDFNLDRMYEHARQFVLPILEVQTATRDAGILRRVSSRERNAKYTLGITISTLCIIAIIFPLLVAFWPKLSITGVIPLLFAFSFVSGVFGGTLSLLIGPTSKEFNETISGNAFITRKSLLGGIAGFLAFLLYAIPQFAGGMSVQSRTETQTVVLLFMILLIAIVAGYAGEAALENVISRAETISKRGHSGDAT